MLVEAYPTMLNASMFDWDTYMWAVQLWASYAMELQDADGDDLGPALVPLAFFANHGAWPHVLWYSRMA